MNLKRKPKQPERKDICVYIGNIDLNTVEDAKALKYQFHKEFKPGTKGHSNFNWFDFSTVEDKDVFLSLGDYCEDAYIHIPESPGTYAKKLKEYNEKLDAYERWAEGYVDEIAAEEKKRVKAVATKKRNKLLAINKKIAELGAQAKELEDGAP